MHLLGFPSERDFDIMVRSKITVNFPVTFYNVKNAKLIFGPDITSLKVKSVRRKPASIVLESRKELEVSTDIMFVKKIRSWRALVKV